jgi:hypothetical protein
MAPKKAPLGTTPRRPGEADRDAIETQITALEAAIGWGHHRQYLLYDVRQPGAPAVVG